MYSNPYYDYGSGELGSAFAGVFACAALFTLLFVVLYLWLFYRIFEKAGYSGWYTLLNLIPYVGSVVVVFMLAFGDWPILRRQAPPSYGPPMGYPPAAPGGYVPPVNPPAQPGGYVPQAPAPVVTPPPPAQMPGEEPPATPPAPPAPPA